MKNVAAFALQTFMEQHHPASVEDFRGSSVFTP